VDAGPGVRPPSRRALLTGAALLGLGGLGPWIRAHAGAPGATTGQSGGVQVSVAPVRPQPGDVVLFQVTGAPPDVRAEWDGRPVSLFPNGSRWVALIGIDLDTRPGSIGWRVTRPSVAKNGGALAAGAVTVRSRTFPTQPLTLPKGMVDLDAATLARVETERGELKAALADSAGERLWRGPFRTPVEGGRPTGGFGLRRVINGQPRSPHTGYDWAAPVGTPVLAANVGRVALVAEHFFAGRNIVLDHGLGLFTFYYHLDETRVGAGEPVAAGQVIGAVGATGRVTGPHLHFAVVLAGARVDPESLLALTVPSESLP
jgi:murein DD-endopeptidase MepM/ murein hydrolase activator NlpD